MKRFSYPILFTGCFFSLFVLSFLLFPFIAYPAPSTYYDTVQKIYIGYYQRPADPAGLIYWAERLDASNGNLNEIIEAFASSDESQALYGTINSSNIATVVNGIYLALFGRDAEIAGRDWYVAEFNAGRFTAATIMLNVLYGTTSGPDFQSVTNKLTASNLFTKTIDPELDNTNFLATYAGNSDAIAARNFLALYATSSQVPTQAETTAYIKEYIADSGDGIFSDSGDDEADIVGLWSVRLTNSGADPTTVVRYVYFSQSDTETVCLIEIGDQTTSNNVTISGNNIITSWTEEGRTVLLQGYLSGETMAGIWSDNAGGSGTWQAARGLASEAEAVLLGETDGILLEVQEAGTVGSAVYYGSDDGSGNITVTGCDVTMDTGTLEIAVNGTTGDAEFRSGSMRIVMHFSAGGALDYEIYMGAELVYSGSGISAIETGTLKAASTQTGSSANLRPQPSNSSDGDDPDEPSFGTVIASTCAHLNSALMVRAFHMDNMPNFQDPYCLYFLTNANCRAILNQIAILNLIRDYRTKHVSELCRRSLDQPSCVSRANAINAFLSNYVIALSNVYVEVLKEEAANYHAVIDEVCSDAADNDGDSLVDCADPDCAGKPGPGGTTCEQPAELTCNDLFDNDGDLYFDCDDPDCDGKTGPGGQICGQTNLCTSYLYGEWGACQPDNTQTRTVVSGIPAGCVGGATPVTTQACTYGPNILGTYKGSSYTVQVWGCEEASDNGTYSGPITIYITTQNGSAFSGTADGTLNIEDFSADENITYSGTITASGAVSGNSSHTFLGTTGEGTFTGQLNGNTLTIVNTGHDTSGDTCSYRRNITATRQ